MHACLRMSISTISSKATDSSPFTTNKSSIKAAPFALSKTSNRIYVLPSSLLSNLSSLKGRDILDGLFSESLQGIPRHGSCPDIVLDEIQIKDFRYIGSYSWVKTEIPTIIVPGSPPEWQNRSTPYNVQPDTGVRVIDQNLFRLPSTPLLPLIAAVDKMAIDEGELPFEWASVDFVTDRNELTNLFGWIGGRHHKDFRIDMQLAGTQTVLFNHWESIILEQFSGRTYGYNFTKASTMHTPGCKEGTGHYRIVTYVFAGIKIVIRYEVDACIPPPTDASSRRRRSMNINNLTQSLAAVDLAAIDPSASEFVDVPAYLEPRRPPVPPLTIIKAGSYVSQMAIIELATHSEWKAAQFNWREARSQLFFSQTMHHYLALHRRGRYKTINKRKLSSPELRAVETDVQVDLKKLAFVLKTIQKIVIKNGQDGRLSLVFFNGNLKIYKRKGQASCLPDEVISCFSV